MGSGSEDDYRSGSSDYEDGKVRKREKKKRHDNDSDGEKEDSRSRVKRHKSSNSSSRHKRHYDEHDRPTASFSNSSSSKQRREKDKKRGDRRDKNKNENESRDADLRNNSISQSDSDDGSNRREARHGRQRDDKVDRKRHRRSKEHRRRSSRSSKDRHRRHRRRSEDPKKDKKRKRRRRKRYSSSSSSSSSTSSSSSDSDSDSSSDSSNDNKKSTKTILNPKLLEKLNARNETLEERKERRLQKRANKITTKFGYTADDNPFHDPNLHEPFHWNKKKNNDDKINKKNDDTVEATTSTLDQIEQIRQRRIQRQQEQDERIRIQEEENRFKELEHYDEWATKEEEFHLLQQKQRSAIRLLQGREKPIDVLCKNLLVFGDELVAAGDGGNSSSSLLKYQEKYNALQQVQERLDMELEEPYKLLQALTKDELQELSSEINAFITLERQAKNVTGATNNHDDDDGDDNNIILKYWNSLLTVVQDELKYLQAPDMDKQRKNEILTLFKGQSKSALQDMEQDVIKTKLQNPAVSDRQYWVTVHEQLQVQFAKIILSDIHSKMLVRQLERLQQRKLELAREKQQQEEKEQQQQQRGDDRPSNLPANIKNPEFGNLEEELGLTDEVDLTGASNNNNDGSNTTTINNNATPNAISNNNYFRKPRYFNRVKTGYDWNKYNQTHYDHDNPPPKTVQGYKFNIFYPDLVDPTKTPQFSLEPIPGVEEFCIIRFHAGPPYQDLAFKIINREWNKSRKRGFKCTFERGILSLYFNFTTHWYRR